MSDIETEDYYDGMEGLAAKCKNHEATLKHIMETFCGIKVGDKITFDMAPAFVEGQLEKQSDQIDNLTESNRQLREELEKVKASEHPWAKALSKKYLDPECSDGCQSLKRKNRIEFLTTALVAAKEALQRIATQYPIDDGESLARHKCEQARDALARIAECERSVKKARNE